MTLDRWGEVNILSKFQLLSFYNFGVLVFSRYFHEGSLNQDINSIVNDEGVCKTALTTPGWLNIVGAALINQACIAGCARTLSDATLPIDKINQFSKIAVNLESIMRF